MGSDGSTSSLLAVDRAAVVAARSNALLVLVCAYHPQSAREHAMLNVSLADSRFNEVRGVQAAQATLEVATRRADEAGVGGSTAVLYEGDAGEALLHVAQERSADLIVVASRGRNALSRRLLGSVPSDVTQRAACDVLVVHTAEPAG